MNAGRDDLLGISKAIIYQNMGSPDLPVARHIHVGPDVTILLRYNNEYKVQLLGQRNPKIQRLKQVRS